MQTRNTIQKKVILDQVLQMDHPTAQAVYEAIEREHPSISKATVYRNLNLLVDSGTLRHISLPDGADHFDFTVADHYHIFCTKCGKLQDVPALPTEDFNRQVGNLSGFDSVTHDIVFYGVCPACKGV